ncbi:hypothetical protein AMATHDRAFT_991 [Amanita thiersii Skay4041]|uniref:DNA polymerase kappa n=1 Tax=Amanita thiersii Skay4041 TaxID=703135 RepID=A0A2A9P005_9AGAR|nr:hypothetical protein AMATHDRAFT_991 [Amanita thiersii Skay4041]
MKEENTEESKQASQETESLVKRLAGPSTGKAGYDITFLTVLLVWCLVSDFPVPSLFPPTIRLQKDQTEINRIIADASKGSKFYENEKRKDKDLTERIRKILKQRDEAMKGADISRIEALVDNMLSELEAQRDLSQIIVHVDMDAFFANVELLYNPDLEGKPFGVGHGVLTTASYEARKYGVRSGMPTYIAKKLCPELILVSNHFQKYMDKSKQVMDVFRRYDPSIAIAGCDEGYLNITPYCEEHGLTPDECVQEMRSKVFEDTQLTASAGIAPNKVPSYSSWCYQMLTQKQMLAKICSDKNKPNGQFHLPFDAKAIVEFMRDLSIRKVPGVGRVNERLLESIGIKTCGDIYQYRATVYLMDKQFGLGFLLRTYLGIGSNVVQPYQREERKSIGAERTFSALGDKEKIFNKLEEIAQELEHDMETNGWTGRTVTLKYKLDTYQVFTRAKSMDKWITKKEDLFAIGKELLMPEFPLRLRLIGLRVTKLKDLRNQASSSAGIKRFFESVKHDSPRKKPRLNDPQTVQEGLNICDPEEGHGENDESMPGFHEDDERDLEPSQHEASDEDEYADGEDKDLEQSASTLSGKKTTIDSKQRPRPPVSAPAGITIHTRTFTEGNDASKNTKSSESDQEEKERQHQPRRVLKPASVAHTSTTGKTSSSIKPSSFKGGAKNTRERVASREEPLECPICGRTLMTDNQGLNAHVDFCLSRTAIREAQAESIISSISKKPMARTTKR